jgi:hypothetical protein
MIANKAGTIIENPYPIFLIQGVYEGWLIPKDWKAEENPCHRWNPRTSILIT